jgi:hypothetical protein
MNLRFLYTYCNDLPAVRRFYSELLELREVYFEDGSEGGLAYKCDELQFTFLPCTTELPIVSEWHNQPGWKGGTLPAASWSIACDSREQFAAAVTRLRKSGATSRHDVPQWVGYWSYPVKDPMGNTVEVTFAPAEPPPNQTWQP